MRLNNILHTLSGAGRDFIRREYRKRKVNPPGSIQELCSALFSNKGYALGTALATEVVSAYGELTEQERLAFFTLLLNQYGPDPELIQQCAADCGQDLNVDTMRKLVAAVEAPRRHLLSRINMAPQGTETIVSMRRDLLGFLNEHPELEIVDDDFQHLLSSWFNPGFLELRTFDWDTPASILEKLITYEAVHEMTGWQDLRRRLQTDRRCFGFFHPALPGEPLIFVEVALVNGMADSIQTILSPFEQENSQATADTAIFYSISNCQVGLKGISFGNFLIKHVVLQLQRELPQLKQFATLSPIPGFSKWLKKHMDDGPDDVLTIEDHKTLEITQLPGWQPEADQDESLKKLLLRLCAHYLHNEKRGDQPLDPVARFHLGNGASIERLNWCGDNAERGVQQSAGILVNYRYDLNTVEANHEQFINNGAIVCSKQFLSQLKG